MVRTLGAMSEPLPRLRSVVVPTKLDSGALSEPLGQYLKTVGVQPGRQTTYSGMLFVLGASLGEGRMPGSLAGLFSLVGWDTKHSVYGAFTETRAQKANHDTVRERREVLWWLGGFAPRFIIVDIKATGKQAKVLKACLALPVGMCPVALRRSDGEDLIGEMWTELSQAAFDKLPLVTTSLEPLVLETVLAASLKWSFDHFAVVDPLYEPASDAAVTLDWGQPAFADGLGFSDRLQSSGVLVRGGKAHVGWIKVDGSVTYLAYGPSPAGRYYLQRLRSGGARETMAVLRVRATALDHTHLVLDGWPIESLAMRRSARFSYARVGHAVVMASGYSLARHGQPTAPAALPEDWTRIYEAWGDPAMNARSSKDLL